MKPHSKHILSLLLLSISTLQAFAGVAEFPFSVSPDKQVTFSSGNLQYNAAQGTHTCADGSTKQGTWRFAEHQWDFVGDATSGNVYQNGIKCDNSLISESYDGWIDLFGWGTSGWNSGANAYQPWATSASYSDFYPGGNYTNNLTGDFSYADWGQYNAVGDDPAGTWRTLSKDEWAYLIQTRPNANSKYGAAKVNGLAGLVILSDEFTLPEDCSFTAGMTNASRGNVWSDVASTNIYTYAQWQQMEAAGAVFLPCAGRRIDATMYYAGTYGGYWSSTADNENDTYGLGFESNVLYWRNGIRNHGYSVRLVQDKPIFDSIETAAVCIGEVIEWHGQEISATPDNTVFTALLRGAEADTVITLTVTVFPRYDDILEEHTVYSGESVEWEGTTYSVNTDLTRNLRTIHGCDSVVRFVLHVADKPFVTRDSVVELCEGEEFDFYGESFAQSAVSSVTRPGETTDTVVTLRLTVWPTYAVELTDTVLSGQTLTLNAESFAEEGDHVLRLESTHHCDSILTLHLVVNSVELTGVQANAQCAGEQTVELEIAHTGTVHEVQLSFDEEARRAGWQDITLPMPEDGFISLPATARAGDYMLTLQLLFRGQTVATHTVPVRLLYPASVMEQAWNDVIAVLTRDYNGGYDFVAFQWYENGQPLNGETRSYLYRPLVMGAEYSALLTEQDGTQSMTCPLIATPQTDVTLYPTIATPNQLIHCHLSQAAVITVYDALGRKLTTASLAAGDNTFPAPPAKGVYLIRICTSASDTAQTCKLIIR